MTSTRGNTQVVSAYANPLTMLPPLACFPVHGAVPSPVITKCSPEDAHRIDQLIAEVSRDQEGVTNGGSISVNREYWLSFARSDFIRRLITEGAKIPFKAGPPKIPARPPKQYPFTLDELVILRPLVQEYLRLGAIRIWEGSHKNVFLNKIFPIVKADGKSHRLIFNAKPINRFVNAPQFAMDTVMKAMQSVHVDDLLASADLSNAYMSIPIHPDHQRFLGFEFEGQVYVFRTLPFGLNAAPWLFTKVMIECLAPLRAKGYRVFGYIDDLFIAELSSRATTTVINIVRHLRRCGWLINLKKSDLEPKAEIGYLGFLVNAPRQMVFVPEAKLARARTIIREALDAQSASHREIWKLMGFLNHLMMAFQCGQFTMWPLRLFQSHLAIDAWKSGRAPWTNRVRLPQDVRETLAAWESCLDKWNGRSVLPLKPTITITTDACTTVGWGGWIQFEDPTREIEDAAGRWTRHQLTWHANHVELQGALNTLNSFIHLIPDRSVIRFRQDSQVSVWYISKMGGRKPYLNAMARQFCFQLLMKGCLVVPEYIPGEQNTRADRLSRMKDRNDWRLNRREVFSEISHLMGSFSGDMFASCRNRQLPVFWSWMNDPEASAVDALRQPWHDVNGYANPPWVLIPKILQKVRAEQASIVLVCPLWPSAHWFPELLSLTSGPTLLLPDRKDLFLPVSRDHQSPISNPAWRAIAVRISGRHFDDSDMPSSRSRELLPICGASPLSSTMHLGNALYSISTSIRA